MSANNLRTQAKINWIKAIVDEKYGRSMEAREMAKDSTFKQPDNN